MIYLNLSRETGRRNGRQTLELEKTGRNTLDLIIWGQSVDVLAGIGGITRLKRSIILWHDNFTHNGNIVSKIAPMTTLEYNNQYMDWR